MSFIRLKDVDVECFDNSSGSISLRTIILSRFRQISSKKKIKILTDINLDIKSGSRVAFIGKNGSGKTSLMRAICGSYPPSKGSIETSGSILSMMNLGIGLQPKLSGRYNVKLLFLYNNNLDQYSKELEDEIIKFSEIDPQKIDMPIKIYSSGMIARLIFSSIAFQKGNIMLMDEVFATGDAEFIKKADDFMYKKWSEIDIGVTISHNEEELLRLSDYAYIVESGRITHDGTTQKMLDLYNSNIVHI
jgi:lipopolysaccharide transport system ATP-binding protein